MGVIASDIPGSSITTAYQNYQQDRATRKFLVEDHSRADALASVTSTLSTAAHPDNTSLLANQITCQYIGGNRWIATVQYERGPQGIFPDVSNDLYNLRVSYESVEVYCTPTKLVNGLPFGGDGTEFVNPSGPAGQSTDPEDRPQPWIYHSPVLNIQLPFSQTTNPITNFVSNVGKIARLAAFNITCRFDGGEVKAVRPSAYGATRYYGVDNYTYKQAGFYKQTIKWDTEDGEENGRWKAVNVRQNGYVS
tara:strand:+ start:1995 stop:2744 length:750 start_codon:yes stop_codon:yes gene_type:complete